MSLSVKVWSDKARQAAQAARRGEYTPGGGASTLSPAVQQRVKEILAEKANKGKKKKTGGGKAKAKGKAGKDPQAAKEKAQEKAQRAAERAQRQKEHAEDRAQRAKEREQKQKEHDEDRAQKQKEHQEAAALRAKKEAEREQDRAARLKKQKKARKAMDIAIKAGARHSRTDQQHIQSIHDSAVACGADCGMDGEADDGDDTLEDAGKAIKAMRDDPRYYAMHECSDIMQAASALSNLCMLMQSEMSEGDEDATDVSQLCDACRILIKFIESELDECEGAASDSAETIGHEPMKAMVSGDDATAQKLLARAVARHKRHMNGTEPTDEDSQQQLMDDMQAALKAIAKREDVSPADKKRAVAEYGDVTYADEKNKKYPVDTPEHVRAAWNYANKEQNAAKYSAEEIAAIKRKIIAAWKKLIDEAGPPSAESKALDLIHVDGGAIKALDGDEIGGYAVLFGTAETPDLEKDYYTKATDMWLDHFGWPRPITYHHGLDPATRNDPVVGHWLKATVDDTGVWMSGQLDKAHRYYKAIKELAHRGYLKLSSDSAPQWVLRERDQQTGANFVKRWPIVTSSVTVCPMEPRMLPVEVKAFLAELGLEGIDESQEADDTDNRERSDETKADEDRARRLLLELELLEIEMETV